MKALRFHQFGHLDNLKLEELPDPTPSKGEAVVGIRAASINPSDLRNIEGKMEGTTLPRTPGRDFSGVVTNGPKDLLGTEVWGTGGDVGFTRDGSHAEFIVIPEEAAIPKPANLSFEEAASVGVPYVTAYEGLVFRANLQAGDILLVTGAQGAVGAAALQLGQFLGARLIAVDRKSENAAAYENLTLLGQVDTTRQDVVGAVRQITNGKGVNVVFDCVGGELFEPVLSTLTIMGRQIAITSAGQRRVGFDLLDFYHRRLTLHGLDSRAFTITDCAKYLKLLSPLFHKGHIKPPKITKRGPLEDAQQLYTQVNTGAGKALFVLP